MVFKYADEIKGKRKNKGLLLVCFFLAFSSCSWRISLKLKRVNKTAEKFKFSV